jgi:hypothetical protein
MTEPAAEDHDQRLKVLLKEFFEQFFLCFFPAWAARLDFSVVEWLDKEVFLAPPQGEKRHLDLVAKMRLRPEAPPPQEGVTELMVVVHVEVESRESAAAFRPRMFDYYVELRRETKLAVLPIVLFLRVGLDGVGWEAYEEVFWEHRLLLFQYAYVGLPALDGEQYATGENLLGVALSTLMRVTPQRRAELYLESLQRIARSGQNDWRRFLLAECLEAYADFDDEQKQQIQALAASEQYQEARPLMITTFERGILLGQRQMVLEALEEKFGSLSPEVQRRVEALSTVELKQLLRRSYKVESLKDLGLED